LSLSATGALLRHLSTQFFNGFVPVKSLLGSLFVNGLEALFIGFLINFDGAALDAK
jgi:fluoride ion exporter CrcB/FEX